MDEQLKNLNEDKIWSDMDVWDLECAVANGNTIAEIADFLMRREDEIVAKIVELDLEHPETGKRAF